MYVLLEGWGLNAPVKACGRDLRMGKCVCVWGGVRSVPLYSKHKESQIHFLPFPQEGTHTLLNLTPAAAASRPGVFK